MISSELNIIIANRLATTDCPYHAFQVYHYLTVDHGGTCTVYMDRWASREDY
jgi:hypothetical protein